MFFVNHFSVSKSFATANHFGEVSFSWWNFFRAKNGPRIILVKDHFSVEKLYVEWGGGTDSPQKHKNFRCLNPISKIDDFSFRIFFAFGKIIVPVFFQIGSFLGEGEGS